jgi:lysophospholipase L1-like esterase
MRGTPKHFNTIEDFLNCTTNEANAVLETYWQAGYWAVLGCTRQEMAIVRGAISLGSSIIVCEGDSLTFGSYSTDPYPDQLRDDWLISDDLTVYNVSGSGERMIDHMLDQAASQVDVHYNAAKENNIAVLWAGTNDLGLDADTAENVAAGIATWGAGRQAAGFQVLVCTLTANQSGFGGIDKAVLNAERLELNALIRANWQSYADGLVDLANDPILGSFERAATDRIYWVDGLHLTNLGYAIVARLVTSAIFDLF